jgi:type IV pilus assembly protein PilA
MKYRFQTTGASKKAGPQSGFTLIELMGVIAIVSILVVIALPAYLDYATRSKVSEGLAFVSEAKTSITEYYHSNRKLPVDNVTAGLPAPSNYNRYDYIRSLSVGSDPSDGTITVNFKLPGTEADNKNLQLVPDTSGAYVIWSCQPAPDPDGIANKFIPPNCRGL